MDKERRPLYLGLIATLGRIRLGLVVTVPGLLARFTGGLGRVIR
jgi:hypothetical protein